MKRFILLTIIAITLLGSDYIFSQQNQSAYIGDFSFGINTMDDVTKLKLGESEVCHNWDLSKSIGRLAIRDGYDSLFAIPGIDSFLWNGLMTYKQSDGNKRLLFIGDSLGVGYSNIYASDLNTFDFNSKDTFVVYPDEVTETIDTSGNTVSSIDTILDTTVCFDCKVYEPTNGSDSGCFYWVGPEHPTFDSCWTTFIIGFDGDTITFTVDSTYDTTFSDFTFDTITADTFAITITIGDFNCNDTIIFDSAYSKNDICDSFAVIINASCGDSVTASVDNDSLDIVEDVFDMSVVLTLTKFTHSRTGGQMDGTGRVGTFFPSTGEIHHVQYRENIYVVNGVGKGVRYDGNSIHKFPLPSAGEMNVLPLSTPGDMNGEFRYGFIIEPKEKDNDTIFNPEDESIFLTKTGALISYITTPVKIDSGQVRLSFFPLLANGMGYPIDTTFTVQIWRTTGDIGAIDKSDTIWFTGMTIDVDSSDYYNETTIFVIDNISDDSLRLSTTFTNIVKDELLNQQLHGQDDTLTNGNTALFGENYVQRYNRAGAPALIGWSSANGNLGIWDGVDETGGATVPNWEIAAGWSYVLVAVDTLNKTPADTGATLNLFQHAKPLRYDGFLVREASGPDEAVMTNFDRDSTEKLTLVLPSNNDNILYQLYRGAVVPIDYDTTEIDLADLLPNWIILGRGIAPAYTGKEFAVFGYYLIGEFSPNDTVIDSMPYTELLGQIPLVKNSVPKMPNYIATYDNRLMLADDDGYIYISDRSDTAVTFDVFKKVAVNRYDGDFIKLIFPEKNALRILKNHSSYNMRKLSNGFWGSAEIQDHYGCVSTMSYASAPEGNYFLSADGIRLERENIYKDNSYLGTLKTRNIKWFRDATTKTLSRNYSTYYDNKYICSFPEIDTSFIVFKIPQQNSFKYAVGTWGLTMVGSAKYSITPQIEKRPDDSLYFIKSGGKALYRFGNPASDNGTPITAEWRSGALFPLSNMYAEPTAIDLFVKSEDTSSVALVTAYATDKIETFAEVYQFGNERRKDFGGLDTAYVHSYDYAPMNPAYLWRLWIFTNSSIAAEAEIIGVNIDFVNRGLSIRK